MYKFKINYDNQPNEVVNKILSLLRNFNLEITQLDGGDGYIEYKLDKIKINYGI